MSAKLVVVDRDGTLIDFHRDAELGVVTPAFHGMRSRTALIRSVTPIRGRARTT